MTTELRRYVHNPGYMMNDPAGPWVSHHDAMVEIERLRAALERYGHHTHPNCHDLTLKEDGSFGPRNGCLCGFDSATGGRNTSEPGSRQTIHSLSSDAGGEAMTMHESNCSCGDCIGFRAGIPGAKRGCGPGVTPTLSSKNIAEEPKEPERISIGRYGEPLWSYAGEVGSHSEMGRKYERDRADYWKAKYEALHTHGVVSHPLPEPEASIMKAFARSPRRVTRAVSVEPESHPHSGVVKSQHDTIGVLARRVVRMGNPNPDHACRQCVPEGGDLIKPWFVCAYHLASYLVTCSEYPITTDLCDCPEGDNPDPDAHEGYCDYHIAVKKQLGPVQKSGEGL